LLPTPRKEEFGTHKVPPTGLVRPLPAWNIVVAAVVMVFPVMVGIMTQIPLKLKEYRPRAALNLVLVWSSRGDPERREAVKAMMKVCALPTN
jgi:hypothetical protein